MSGSEQESYAQRQARNSELEQRRQRIRQLNDLLRVQHVGGRINITCGIDALGPDSVLGIIQLMRSFDSFSEDNDPYQERDFGALEYGQHRVFWKIDYYDKQLEFGSPDAADPAVTARVLTIMLAEEY